MMELRWHKSGSISISLQRTDTNRNLSLNETALLIFSHSNVSYTPWAYIQLLILILTYVTDLIDLVIKSRCLLSYILQHVSGMFL